MKRHLIQLASFLTYFFLASQSQAQVNDPVLTVSGTSTSQQTVSVTVTESTSGVTINYTTDGTIPTQSSPSLTSPTTLLIPVNATLKVQAFMSPTVTSNMVSTQFAHAAVVSAGTAHTLFLKDNGTVYASGDNSAGELGNGTTTNSNQPVQVLTNSGPALNGIVSIAAANNESFAVDNQGRVWAWGLNTNGNLGLGNSTATTSATQLSGLSNVIAIAAGQYHTVALRADGSVWAWGANNSGQVGNGTQSAWVTQPTQVISPNTQSGPYIQSIVAIAAGANHCLAIDNSGKVYAWGDNSYGELGDGDAALASQTQPVLVKNNSTPLANIVGISADGTNSYALNSSGTTYAWGNDTLGELGNGTTSTVGATVTLSPGQVVNLGTMTMVSNESAIDSTGTVWTWGDNTNGRLGIGYSGYYATVPLAVSLNTQSTPTLTVTAGNGQTVTGGMFSAPFTISATAGSWVDLIINPSSGVLGLSNGATQLSPIIGGRTNSSGQISFYLKPPFAGSGAVNLTATSGSSSTNLTATETSSEIFVTGSPSYRSAVTTSIKNILNSGYGYLYSGTTPGSENAALVSGVLKSTGQAVVIATSWSGTGAGVQTVAGNLPAKFIPLAKLSGLSGSVGNAVDPTSSSAGTGDIDSEAGVQICLSDAFQNTTGFYHTYGGSTYATLKDTLIGVVPFEFVASPGFSGSNMTSELARELWTTGGITLDQFTNNPLDNINSVYAMGRNPDAGARLIFQAQVGEEVAPGAALNQYAPADSQNNPLQVPGSFANIVQYPAGVVDGISRFAGDNGYASGDTLARVLGGSTYPANTYMVTYLNVDDASTAVGLGAKILSYNGVSYSVSAVQNGVYTLWGYEHLDTPSGLATLPAKVASDLSTDIINNTATIKISTLKYNRSGDGSVVE